MNEIKWVINKLFVIPEKFGIIDVVYRINYSVTAKGYGKNGELVIAEIPTSVALNLDKYESGEKNGFTQFSELTEEIVVKWVKEAMGEWHVDNLESMVEKSFKQKLIDAETVIKPLPWKKDDDENMLG